MDKVVAGLNPSLRAYILQEEAHQSLTNGLIFEYWLVQIGS